MREPLREPTSSSGGGTDGLTLEDAGYSSGEFYPQTTYSTRTVQTLEDASGNWVNGYGVNEFQVDPGDFDAATFALKFEYRGNAHGAEIGVRMWNDTDAEVVPGSSQSVTGSGWQNWSAGPMEYTPPTTGSPVTFQTEFQSVDGSTNVILAIAQAKVGVFLPE